MANNVIVQVLGGNKKILDNVETVKDVKTKMGLAEGYTAAIDEVTANDTDKVQEGNFVTLSKSVKGGC
jgi:hypothetical protein